jgi:hypothetical protein
LSWISDLPNNKKFSIHFIIITKVFKTFWGNLLIFPVSWTLLNGLVQKLSDSNAVGCVAIPVCDRTLFCSFFNWSVIFVTLHFKSAILKRKKTCVYKNDGPAQYVIWIIYLYWACLTHIWPNLKPASHRAHWQRVMGWILFLQISSYI